MKITKKNLEKLIREEVRKILEQSEKTISEYDDDTLRHAKAGKQGFGLSQRDRPAGQVKVAPRGLSPEGHAKVLEELLARLSRIEGKIDALAGRPGMSTPS